MSRRAVALIAIASAQAAYAVACVDGVTPDCSDPATKCGPDFDGSFDGAGDGDAPQESAADTAPDVRPDADTDADLDAGDEG